MIIDGKIISTQLSQQAMVEHYCNSGYSGLTNNVEPNDRIF